MHLCSLHCASKSSWFMKSEVSAFSFDICFMMSCVYAASINPSTKSFEKYSKILTSSSSTALCKIFETIEISSNDSTESWFSISKLLMLSISSSQKSTRYGRSFEYEKTSKMLPLIENCPGSYTKSTLSNP